LLTAGPASAAVRVDQLGYAPGEEKIGYLIAAKPGERFTVVDAAGDVCVAGPGRQEPRTLEPALEILDETRRRSSR
jgi:Cellulase N-terminal ig-like domain